MRQADCGTVSADFAGYTGSIFVILGKMRIFLIAHIDGTTCFA
jgi:hypothetical protein